MVEVAGRGRSIILIGMPGAGKSTVGEALAKALDTPFVDTDILVEEMFGGTLAELMAEEGTAGFKALEGRILRDLRLDDHVIATGGSVVLDDAAMANLKRLGTVVFIEVSLEILAARVGDIRARGVVGAETMSLAEIWAEREPLYREWADFVVSGVEVEDVVGAIWGVL